MLNINNKRWLDIDFGLIVASMDILKFYTNILSEEFKEDKGQRKAGTELTDPICIPTSLFGRLLTRLSSCDDVFV